MKQLELKAGRRSDEFKMNKGIKQGDSLSPLLFIIIMDKVIIRIKEKQKRLSTVIESRNLEFVKLSSLLYADDDK